MHSTETNSPYAGYAPLDANGQRIFTAIQPIPTAGIYKYLELEDNLESWGSSVSLPIEGDNLRWTMTAGLWNSKKDRAYYGYSTGVSAAGLPLSVL